MTKPLRARHVERDLLTHEQRSGLCDGVFRRDRPLRSEQPTRCRRLANGRVAAVP
ncbi:MAG: hypothetical protein ACRDYA_23450 [Egibacteraceae bacterium]